MAFLIILFYSIVIFSIFFYILINLWLHMRVLGIKCGKWAIKFIVTNENLCELKIHLNVIC